MSLRTLERDAPSLFKNRLPAPTQLAVFCALSLALMVADARLQITAPLRQALATVLYPVQLALLQPLRWISDSADYLEKLETAQRAAHEAEALSTKTTTSMSLPSPSHTQEPISRGGANGLYWLATSRAWSFSSSVNLISMLLPP